MFFGGRFKADKGACEGEGRNVHHRKLYCKAICSPLRLNRIFQ
jgi:hypothetical protein